MAQRGGAVLARLRISDTDIASDLVPTGSADLIISMDPIESLEEVIKKQFASKEQNVIEANLKVLALGRDSAK